MDKNRKGLGDLIDLFLLSKDKEICLSLLDLFLTAEEKRDVEMRLLIVKELLKGEKTQRQIAKDLSVSIAKITRGSNELKRMNRKLLMYLKKRVLE